MLKSLTIKNYILIESLEFYPEEGLNIIIGETGAGKSILLGAIGLLTGQRADTKTLRNESEKCVVEGIFDISVRSLPLPAIPIDSDNSDTLIIRREISPQGKSRAFINDTPITLDVLQEIAAYLLDIHSQHDHLLLANPNFQLDLVDAFITDKTILEDFRFEFQKYKKLESDLLTLQEEIQEAKKHYDYDLYALQELKTAKLETFPDTEALEKEQELLSNAQEIKSKLAECCVLLNDSDVAILPVMGQIMLILTQTGKLASHFDTYKNRLWQILADLKELSKDLNREADRVELDPERLVIVNDQLQLLYKLLKKHQVTSKEELLEIETKLEAKTEKIDFSDQNLRNLQIEVARSYQIVLQLAERLSENRKKIIPNITEPIKSVLTDLGMPEAEVQVEFEHTPVTNQGIDNVHILFSANKGYKPVPLKNAASGGEFSRLMFAVKYLLAQHTHLPTLVFDEIDTGISGEVAKKMGALMKKMSKNHQMITITHLHQIAAKGDAHFYVYKSDKGSITNTEVKKLTYTDKIEKIAEMIGGANPSETALQSARELLFSE